MDLKFGDIQETALIPLAIKASETARENARIKDLKAKEIIIRRSLKNTEAIMMRSRIRMQLSDGEQDRERNILNWTSD